MPNPVITIAMPFFNSAATIELAIRSLLHQSYGDFELLLCDDGSNDQGIEIARSFDDQRIIAWRDGRRRRLAARLNECIDRARGRYLLRMDADDVAYPNRLASQLAFLDSHPEVDLCGGNALVFGKRGRPLWMYRPPVEHSAITRSPFRGFPLWHPVWMGRIAWFRRWRYQESAWLAQDQELLLRSYLDSCFANLPQTLLGYRTEHISLLKLYRYKLLHIRYVHSQPGGRMSAWMQLQLLLVSTARFAANCLSVLAGPNHRLGHQDTEKPTADDLAEWHLLWTLLSSWYGASNETFSPRQPAQERVSETNSSMKIVQVLTRGDVLGGAQSHVRELSIVLLAMGHDVTVLTGAPGLFTDQLQQAGIPCLQLRNLVRPLRPHRDVAALFELSRTLRALKPDLVCAHTAKAGGLGRAAARLNHLPCVFTPHGWSMFDRDSLRPNPLYCRAEALASRLGTRVINVCEFERSLAQRYGVGTPGTLDMVPNGIPDHPWPRTRPVDAQPPLLVMVARFAPQKDHATLLQALADMLWLEWRLLLVGDGAFEAAVMAQINQLGLGDRVTILPPTTDVAALLMEAQLFLLSTHFEASPISVLEAMRAGLPVIASDVGASLNRCNKNEPGCWCLGGTSPRCAPPSSV